MTLGSQSDYAGEVSVAEAYETVLREPKAHVVDVRTRPEWSFVGVPDLSAAGKDVILVEWQRYPSMEVATDFVAAVENELARTGAGRDDSVLFLCRSGVRSLAAARAMTAAGWSKAFNIEGGFEGPLDSGRKRGSIGGWKAAGLPWYQS